MWAYEETSLIDQIACIAAHDEGLSDCGELGFGGAVGVVEAARVAGHYFKLWMLLCDICDMLSLGTCEYQGEVFHWVVY